VFNAELNQFISIEDQLPVIPFLTCYSLPGWN